MVRATMDNEDELLWPGTLVNAQVDPAQEEAVTLPSQAIQVGQNGTFVFVVENGVAKVRPVTVDRARSTCSRSIDEGPFRRRDRRDRRPAHCWSTGRGWRRAAARKAGT